MKNYYEEVLESLGKQVSELLDKLEKETDEVKRNKLMDEFEVLAKEYLELSNAWQNISERRERLDMDKDKQMFDADMKFREICLEELKNKQKLIEMAIIAGCTATAALLMQAINDRGLTLVPQSIIGYVKDGFQWMRRLI